MIKNNLKAHRLVQSKNNTGYGEEEVGLGERHETEIRQ